MTVTCLSEKDIRLFEMRVQSKLLILINQQLFQVNITVRIRRQYKKVSKAKSLWFCFFYRNHRYLSFSDLMQQNSVKYVKIGYTIQRNLEENRDE